MNMYCTAVVDINTYKVNFFKDLFHLYFSFMFSSELQTETQLISIVTQIVLFINE